MSFCSSMETIIHVLCSPIIRIKNRTFYCHTYVCIGFNSDINTQICISFKFLTYVLVPIIFQNILESNPHNSTILNVGLKVKTHIYSHDLCRSLSLVELVFEVFGLYSCWFMISHCRLLNAFMKHFKVFFKRYSKYSWFSY